MSPDELAARVQRERVLKKVTDGAPVELVASSEGLTPKRVRRIIADLRRVIKRDKIRRGEWPAGEIGGAMLPEEQARQIQAARVRRKSADGMPVVEIAESEGIGRKTVEWILEQASQYRGREKLAAAKRAGLRGGTEM
jgi:hypothetical protein